VDLLIWWLLTSIPQNRDLPSLLLSRRFQREAQQFTKESFLAVAEGSLWLLNLGLKDTSS
jgi:hypothetical protein